MRSPLPCSIYRTCFSTRIRTVWTILVLFVLILGLIAMIYAHYWESRDVRLIEYTVMSPDLPKEFDGMTILLVTDIHHGCWGTFDLRNTIVETVKREQPDLLLFGGDYAEKTYDNVKALASSLKDLSAPLGKFGVPGNHDYVDREMEKTMHILQQQAGIVNLTDKGVWLEKNGQKIRLVGTDYVWNPNFPLQFPRYEILDRTEDEFVLLLTHSPDLIDRFNPDFQRRIDLVLSGHSHGGQITFFGFFAPITTVHNRKYNSGLTELDHYPYEKQTTVITSNGVGTVGIPLRFFASPQIVKITLIFKRDLDETHEK